MKTAAALTLANELEDREEEFKVIKNNKGKIPNVKYGLEIVRRLDDLVEKLYDFPIKNYPYFSAKSRSIAEYNSYFVRVN